MDREIDLPIYAEVLEATRPQDGCSPFIVRSLERSRRDPPDCRP
jgi:hypothetical protein